MPVTTRPVPAIERRKPTRPAPRKPAGNGPNKTRQFLASCEEKFGPLVDQQAPLTAVRLALRAHPGKGFATRADLFFRFGRFKMWRQSKRIRPDLGCWYRLHHPDAYSTRATLRYWAATGTRQAGLVPQTRRDRASSVQGRPARPATLQGQVMPKGDVGGTTTVPGEPAGAAFPRERRIRMLRARTAITGAAALVLGVASAFTLAVPANAQPHGTGWVLNLHYNACLSELGTTPGVLIGLSGCDTNHSEDWTVDEVGTGVFELINYHSNLCLSEDGHTVGVSACDGNHAEYWKLGAQNVPYSDFWQVKNDHWGLCLGANDTGLGHTGANTCSSNNAAFWELVGLE